MTNDLLGGCRSPPLGERPHLSTGRGRHRCADLPPLRSSSGAALSHRCAGVSPLRSAERCRQSARGPTWSPLGSTGRRPCRPCACALRCAPQLRQQQRPAQRPGCHLGRVGAAARLAGCRCLAARRHIVRAPRPPAAALACVGPLALRCARVPLCRRAPPCRAGRARPALRRKETKRARPFVQAAARLHKSPVLYRCRPFWGRRAEASAPLVGRVRRGQLPTCSALRCGGEGIAGALPPPPPRSPLGRGGQHSRPPSGDSVCSAPAPSRARATPRVSICSTGAPVSAIPPAPLDFTAAR